VLESFARFYDEDSDKPRLRRRHDIPSTFESGSSKEIAPAEEEAIRRCLEHLGASAPADENTVSAT
jgi:hypothetical protein